MMSTEWLDARNEGSGRLVSESVDDLSLRIVAAVLATHVHRRRTRIRPLAVGNGFGCSGRFPDLVAARYCQEHDQKEWRCTIDRSPEHSSPKGVVRRHTVRLRCVLCGMDSGPVNLRSAADRRSVSGGERGKLPSGHEPRRILRLNDTLYRTTDRKVRLYMRRRLQNQMTELTDGKLERDRAGEVRGTGGCLRLERTRRRSKRSCWLIKRMSYTRRV